MNVLRRRQKPTPTELAARAEHRATVRTAAAEKVQALREWREARAARALKAAREQAAARNKRPRGVDRVPDRLRGLTITTEPHMFGKRDTEQTRPLAQPADVDAAGNYSTRRARGQRGHTRTPRRRELPGAVARRIERNRKEWLS